MEDNERTVVGGPSAASLLVTMPDGKSFLFPLCQGKIVAGRAPDCDLVLDDATVSRRHAEMTFSGQRLSVVDLGSANGVLVNEEKVASAELGDGDVLKLGTCQISVTLPAAPDATVGDDRTVVRPSAASKGVPGVAFAGAKPAGGRKKLYLVGGATLGLMLLFIILIANLGGERKESLAPLAKAPAPEAPAKATAPTPAAKAPAPAPKAPAAPAAAADKEQAAMHMDQGRVYLEAGRLVDAEAEFKKAQQLDPSNELAALKLKATQDEIQKKADEAFGRGMKNFQFLKYQEAIAEWMTVINLLPDKQNPLHQKAASAIAQAQAKLK